MKNLTKNVAIIGTTAAVIGAGAAVIKAKGNDIVADIRNANERRKMSRMSYYV